MRKKIWIYSEFFNNREEKSNLEEMIHALGTTPGEVLTHLAKNAPEAFFRALICSRNAAKDRKSSNDYLIQEVYRRAGTIMALRLCMQLRGLSLSEAGDYVAELTGTVSTVVTCHGA